LRPKQQLLRLLLHLLARRMPKKMVERRARARKVKAKAKVAILEVLLMMPRLSK